MLISSLVLTFVPSFLSFIVFFTRLWVTFVLSSTFSSIHVLATDASIGSKMHEKSMFELIFVMSEIRFADTFPGIEEI